MDVNFSYKNHTSTRYQIQKLKLVLFMLVIKTVLVTGNFLIFKGLYIMTLTFELMTFKGNRFFLYEVGWSFIPGIEPYTCTVKKNKSIKLKKYYSHEVTL